jgi:hypothetical protein
MISTGKWTLLAHSTEVPESIRHAIQEYNALMLPVISFITAYELSCVLNNVESQDPWDRTVDQMDACIGRVEDLVERARRLGNTPELDKAASFFTGQFRVLRQEIQTRR